MGGLFGRSTAARARRLLLAVVAVLVALLAGQAPAIEPPPELDIVCVDRQDNVFQAVDASYCERDERSFDLPEQRPFHVCAEHNHGKLRYVGDPGQCNNRETPYTVPDSGPQFVCARNARDGEIQPRGQLRRVTDAGQCDPRDETAFVTPAAPVAVDDAYTADEDLLLDVGDRGVLANDQDLTGGALRATLVDSVAGGTLAFDTAGSFRYDPRGQFDHLDEGQTDSVSFTYFTSDDVLDSLPATAVITIAGRNDEPVAVADADAVDEDSVLSVGAPGVLGNDSDAESHPLEAVLVAAPSRGHLDLAPDGSFTFDPAGAFEALTAGEEAIVTFDYLARDGTADSDVVTVAITVTGLNDAPVALAEAYETDENSPLSIPAPGVLANDTDVEGQALTAELLGQEPAATVSLYADGGFAFDPRTAFDGLETGQTGVATFTYRAVDSGGAASSATVTISVRGRSVPVAVDDEPATDEDTQLALDLLANDVPHGGAITTIDTTGTSGVVTGPDERGVVTYDPRGQLDGLAAGEPFEDAFGYTVENDEGTSTAQVRVAVTGRNDAPVAAVDGYDINEGEQLVVPAPGVLGNDDDVDGDALTAVLVTPPTRGRLVLAADGSLTFDPADDIPAGETTVESFSYRASDGTDESATTTVSITVIGVNAPPVVDDQTFAVDEHSAVGTVVGTVAFTDEDVDDAHTFAITGGNEAGAFAIDAATGAITVADSAALDFEQTPAFALTVSVSDGTAADTATIRIDLRDIAEVPTTGNDLYTAVGNTELAAGGATPQTRASTLDPRNVLDNDTDPDGGTLSVTPADGTTTGGGRFAIAADGSFRYVPAPGFTGDDSFSYQVTDGTNTFPGTVGITVAGMVWYVDNAATSPGDGTSAAPFPALAALSGTAGGDQAGDTIYLFGSTVAYDGGIALGNTQRLIGQGADLVVGDTLIVPRGAAPTITATAVPGVVLATGNTIAGLHVATTGAPAIKGADFVTATLDVLSAGTTGAPVLDLARGAADGTIASASSDASATDGIVLQDLTGTLDIAAGSITGAQGAGVRVTDGSGATRVAATISGAGQRAVDVSSVDGGVLTFAGAISDSAQGITVAGNAADALVRFTGGLALATGTDEAFAATGGGILEVTGAGNTIATTSATALRLVGVQIGPGGARFADVDSDGAAVGVLVEDVTPRPDPVTGASGRLVVNDGLLQNAGQGVAIARSAAVSLVGLDVVNSDGDGVVLTDTRDVVLGLAVDGSIGNGITGVRVRDLAINGTTIVRSVGSGLRLDEFEGEVSLTGGIVERSQGAQVLATDTGDDDGLPDRLRLSGVTMRDSAADNLVVESRGAAHVVLDLAGTTTTSLLGGRTGLRASALAGGQLEFVAARLLSSGGTDDGVVLQALGASDSRPSSLVFDIAESRGSSGGGIIRTGGDGISAFADTKGLLSGTIATTAVSRTGDAGIRLEGAQGVTLDRVDVDSAATNGIAVVGSRGLELSRVTVVGSGTTGISGTNLLGTSTIEQTTVRTSGTSAAPASHLVVRNTTASAAAPAAPTDLLQIVALSAIDSVVPDPGVVAADAVVVESASAGNLGLTFAGPGVSTIDGGGHGLRAEALDGATLGATVTNVRRNGGSGTGVVLGARRTASTSPAATLRYALSSNDATVGGGVFNPAQDGVVVTSDAASTATGTIASTLVDGAQTGIAVRQTGPTAPVAISGSTVSALLDGIVVELTGTTPAGVQTAVDVTTNTVVAGTGAGIRVVAQNNSALCLELDGNDSTTSGTDAFGYELEQGAAPPAVDSSVFALRGLADGETAAAWVARKNTGTAQTTGFFTKC